MVKVTSGDFLPFCKGGQLLHTKCCLHTSINLSKCGLVLRGLDTLVYHFILTHCRLNELPHAIYWKSPISILGTSGYEILIFLEKSGLTICKQWRPWSDATFCGVWSGLLCLPLTLLGVSSLQWVKGKNLLQDIVVNISISELFPLSFIRSPEQVVYSL